MKIKIKVTDLKKDKNLTLRINSDIKKLLESKGHNMQKILDSAIDKILNIEAK